MNRAALIAALAAGRITEQQFTAMLDGGAFRLDLAAEQVTPDPEARTISGVITVYDTMSPDGRQVVSGALTPREPLKRVKMLRDHDHAQPVGYMTTIDPAASVASFYVPEGDDGDRALAEAANGLRDGLSVGLTITEYLFDDDYNLFIFAAELNEVSLCAIPAFQDAGVTTVTAALTTPTKELYTMNRAALAAALAAGTISQTVYDAQLAHLDAVDLAAREAITPAPPATTPTVQAVAPEFAAGPEPVTPARAAVVVREQQALSLNEVVRRVSLAAKTGRAGEVALALQDVIPADDAGEAFILRADWIGEIFRARAISRPWIDSFGVPGQLTSMTRKGFKIGTRPSISKYAGNKTPITSTGKLTTTPVEYENYRWAGGWDIDRAFYDFGDEAYLTAFWNAAVEDYQVQSDTEVGDLVLDAAAANTAVYPNLLAGLIGLAGRGRAIKGAAVNRIKMADDLFDVYANLKQADVPFWLANATTAPLDLTTGDADLAQLHISADSSIPAGNIVAYDTRAAAVLEKSPIQVQAFDIAKGGIDLGFYSYGAFDLYDERLFLSASIGAAAPLALPEPDETE